VILLVVNPRRFIDEMKVYWTLGRMPPAPFRPRLVQLNLERGIRSAEVSLRICHVAGGTPELAQLMVGHFAQAFAKVLYVLGLGLDHRISRMICCGSTFKANAPKAMCIFWPAGPLTTARNLGFDLTPIIKTDKDGRSDI
jgi:hypothetical protein